MLINKFKYIANGSKKVLHKVKKQWVTISVVALGLLGGAGAYTATTPVHINAKVVSQAAVNDNSSITQQADQVHSNLVNNAEKTQRSTMKLGADSNTNSYDNPQSDYDYSDGNMNGNYTYYSDNNVSDNNMSDYNYNYSDNGTNNYDDNGTVINNNNDDGNGNSNVNNNVVGGNGGSVINNNNVGGGNSNVNNNVVGGNGGSVINNNNVGGGNSNVNNNVVGGNGDSVINNNNVGGGNSNVNNNVVGGNGDSVINNNNVDGGNSNVNNNVVGGNGGSISIAGVMFNNQPSKSSDNSYDPNNTYEYPSSDTYDPNPSDSDINSDIITMYGTTYVSENDIYPSDLAQLSDSSAPLQNKLTENGMDYIPMDYVIPDGTGMYHVNSVYFEGASSDTPSSYSDYTPEYTITQNSDGTVTISDSKYVPSDKLTSDGRYVLENYPSYSSVINQSDVEYVPLSDTTPESNGLYNVTPYSDTSSYDGGNIYEDPPYTEYTYDEPSYDQTYEPSTVDPSYETYDGNTEDSSDNPAYSYSIQTNNTPSNTTTSYDDLDNQNGNQSNTYENSTDNNSYNSYDNGQNNSLLNNTYNNIN